MLTNLMNRLNKDSNEEFNRNILVECGVSASVINPADKIIENDTDNVYVDDLKTKLANVKLSETDSIEDNASKIVAAAKNATVAINEAVVSTSKSINMTKEDYKTLLEMLDRLKKESCEDRDLCIKKIKSFLKAVTKELPKCNDDKPADALVIAMVNKMCKHYDCIPEFDNDEITNKYKLIAKVNALAKVVK